MKKFEVKFKHLIEETYTSLIEAETEEEAMKIFDEEPFDHVISEDPEDIQGLDIEIIDTVEVE